MASVLTIINSVSGIPGTDIAASLVADLVVAARNVKVYRQQCQDLANRCRSLLESLRENEVNMEGTDAQRAADEVQAVIEHVLRKAQEWATWNRVKSLVQQSDIQQGINDSYRQIDTCSIQFNISVNLNLTRGQKEQAAIQARDQAELRETLESILRNTDELKTIMGLQPPAVEGIMKSIQEELQSSVPQNDPREDDPLWRGLWELHKWTELLPPLIDLTGQVSKISAYPVAMGGYNDIYTAEWLGEEKVALKLPRAINSTEAAQRRFEREVTIWRHLQHPNVARLYGIAYFGDHVFSVTPWMNNGTAIEYVKAHPETNRSRLLIEIAAGLEYLHTQQIVHGDLRGANILISEAGKPLISDFGLSKVIEELSGGVATSTNNAVSRWFAPELIRPALIGQESVSVSTRTDVWSFGMLCLELMTGEQPFPHIARDMSVAFELVNNGIRPNRPGLEVTARGLNDGLWALMNACWEADPDRRPFMTEIRTHLKDLESGSRPILPSHGINIPLTESPSHIPPDLPVPSTSSSAPKTSLLAPESYDSFDHDLGLARHHSIGSISPYRSSGLSSPNQFNTLPTSFHGRRPSEETISSFGRAPQNSPVSGRSFGHLSSASLGNGSQEPAGRNGPGLLTITRPKAAIRKRSGTSPGLNSPSTPEIQEHSPSSHLLGGAHPDLMRTPSLVYSSELSEHSSISDGHNSRITNLVYSEVSDISSMSSSLRSAVTNPDAHITFADDDSVAAGTLEGLVGKLLDEPKTSSYVSTFFATYRLFVTPSELYHLLLRRFDEFEEDVPPHYRASIRHSILSVLTEWLRSHDIDKEESLLSLMKQFALAVKAPQMTSRLAMEVVGLIDQRLRQPPSLHGPLSSKEKICQAGDITPSKLAVALTILEGARYADITAGDCVLHLRTTPLRNRIDVATETNRMLQDASFLLTKWHPSGVLLSSKT